MSLLRMNFAGAEINLLLSHPSSNSGSLVHPLKHSSLPGKHHARSRVVAAWTTGLAIRNALSATTRAGKGAHQAMNGGH
jgi:hypothetical protein